jgi:hypothetical protein
LYFHAVDFASFRLDRTGLRRGDVEDMEPVPPDVFTYPRGNIDECHGLHIKVKIPPGNRATKVDRELNVSDLFDINNGGQYVRYGSQFADYIFMGVSGIVSEKNPGVAPMQASLAYTEPFVPPLFSLDADVITRRAIAEYETKTFEDAEKAKRPQVMRMMMKTAAMPQSLSARVKIKKRTD